MPSAACDQRGLHSFRQGVAYVITTTKNSNLVENIFFVTRNTVARLCTGDVGPHRELHGRFSLGG
jgi:hypothetical protein